MVIVKDKKVLLAQLLKDVKAHPPTVIVPIHGWRVHHNTVEQDTIERVSAAV